jgi:hypothetical protein
MCSGITLGLLLYFWRSAERSEHAYLKSLNVVPFVQASVVMEASTLQTQHGPPMTGLTKSRPHGIDALFYYNALLYVPWYALLRLPNASEGIYLGAINDNF